MSDPNTKPIFPLVPNMSWGTVTTANTAKDGTGTVVTVFTAGLFGSKIDQIKVRGLGTNVATVLRIFVNNGSDPTVAANNCLVHEETIAATTLSEVAALVDHDILIPKDDSRYLPPIQSLPAGYKINITIGTTIASGLVCSVSGGDY